MSIPIHPGKILRTEFMEPYKLSAVMLCEAIHVPQSRIDTIIAEEKPITADMALRLSRYLSTTPQLWMNLQVAHDLGKAHAKVGSQLETSITPIQLKGLTTIPPSKSS